MHIDKEQTGEFPNLLIVGCQKSGTTWLHNCLGKSSHIFASTPKELNLFTRNDYLCHVDSYLEYFEDKNFQFRLESTPHYFRTPTKKMDIATRIKDLLISPKIIVVFRNPIDRYESAYIHHMMNKRFDYSPSIENLVDEFQMLSLGKYASILRHWRGIFPEMATFFYDDLVENNENFIQEVMDYIGVENDIRAEDLNFRVNDKKMNMERLVDGSQVGGGYSKLAKWIKRGGATTGDTTEWERMPRSTPELRGKLVEFYRDEVRQLEDMTNRCLAHWLQA